MSSGATGLAGRYASALYALAVDSNKVVSIHAELGSLETMLVENQDLKKLVESPILSRGEQQAAVDPDDASSRLEPNGAVDPEDEELQRLEPQWCFRAR